MPTPSFTHRPSSIAIGVCHVITNSTASAQHGAAPMIPAKRFFMNFSMTDYLPSPANIKEL
ncbi:MAG: hypothetical protein JRF02_01715 [Deltaproteobacteria bacterium]|jgi:hypothetical protein|nr:hypothetical protein [Deltaproteobacteria bacterium]